MSALEFFKLKTVQGDAPHKHAKEDTHTHRHPRRRRAEGCSEPTSQGFKPRGVQQHPRKAAEKVACQIVLVRELFYIGFAFMFALEARSSMIPPYPQEGAWQRSGHRAESNFTAATQTIVIQYWYVLVELTSSLRSFEPPPNLLHYYRTNPSTLTMVLLLPLLYMHDIIMIISHKLLVFHRERS